MYNYMLIIYIPLYSNDKIHPSVLHARRNYEIIKSYIFNYRRCRKEIAGLEFLSEEKYIFLEILY